MYVETYWERILRKQGRAALKSEWEKTQPQRMPAADDDGDWDRSKHICLIMSCAKCPYLDECPKEHRRQVDNSA